MHLRACAWLDLDGLNPAIVRKVHRNADVLVFHGAVRGDRERFGHGEHGIRLPDRPAFGHLRHQRHVPVVALRRTAIGPAGDRLHLLIRQARVVLEVADRGIGIPGRHLACDHPLLHDLRVWPRVLVRNQRHRGKHRRPMALDAVLVENGRHILREGRHSVGRSGKVRHATQQHEHSTRNEFPHERSS